jgi:hypothetical protein
VHAAASTLIVHNIEFLIKEGVETDLSILQTFVEVVKDLFIHVENRIFADLAKLEEVT